MTGINDVNWLTLDAASAGIAHYCKLELKLAAVSFNANELAAAERERRKSYSPTSLAPSHVVNIWQQRNGVDGADGFR
jgi:hypothetical protein